MQLPSELAQVVEEAASAFPFRELARAAERISERYRGERPRTGRLSPLECAAWAAVRMPATWAATREVLLRLKAADAEMRPGSVLDIGAGPGGGIHAACGVFESIEHAVALEQEPTLIATGNRFPAPCEWRWLERDIRLGPPFAPHELVLVGWVAGELDEPARELVLRRAWDAAEKALVILEPGTPRGFETIRRARQMLVESGAFLAAPCPSGGPCAAEEGEWCHFAARVERSALHRRLKGGELSYEDEKYSYLVATRAPVRRAEARIVRHPRHEPGLIHLRLCNGETWGDRNVRKREGEAFRRARKARWGDEWTEIGKIQV